MLLSGLALALLAAACSRPAPNIVLISIDSLRRDGPSCFGNPRGTSPNIDALARRGIRFTDAVSTTTWTLPAHQSLLRGIPDDVHGYRTDARPPVRIGGRSLPELLHDQGYQTFGVYSGPYLHEAFGFAGGFDRYERAFFYPTAYDPGAASPGSWNDILGQTHTASHREVTSDEVLSRCLGFINQQDPGRPMFLFAHFFDVHYEYTPPPEFARFSRGMENSIAGIPLLDERIDASLSADDRAYLRALYDDEIAWVDHNVGKLLGELKRRTNGRDTIVMVVSDHGDELFEHGGKGHRQNLYQETLAVPMVLASLGWTLPRDVVVPARVRLIDVAPTLLELAGTRPPGWMMGRSLLGMARDPASARPRDATAELQYQGSQRAFFHDSYKLIALKEEGTAAPRFELFDLARDPGESHPVTDSEQIQAIGAAYNRSLEELQAARRHVPTEVLSGGSASPDLHSLLETLGYTNLPSPASSFSEMLFRGIAGNKPPDANAGPGQEH